VDVILWENNQDIYALAGRRYLSESAGFAPGSMMAQVADEIDELSLNGSVPANQMVGLLNQMPGSVQNAQLTQLYGRGTANYLHVQGLTDGLSQLTRRVTRRPAPAPEGAAGPYNRDEDPRGWIRPYGSWAERSAQGGYPGYDHNIYGTLAGIDWIRGDVLIGLAGGYARSVINQDDGSFSEARTGYGVGYVSVGTEDWFGDINVAVGRSDIEDRSRTVFGNRADYNATDFAVYLGGGKELWSSCGRFCLTPEASVLMSDYYQQAYVEEGMLPKEVSSYDRVSIVSGLGATVAMQQEYDTLILRPEARLRWLHEFNNDSESMDYSLAGGTAMHRLGMADAEEDVIETGAGLTCQFDDQLSLGVDVDWRFGEDYDAYGVSGRLELQF